MNRPPHRRDRLWRFYEAFAVGATKKPASDIRRPGCADAASREAPEGFLIPE
jgi:hypothetical protein